MSNPSSKFPVRPTLCTVCDASVGPVLNILQGSTVLSSSTSGTANRATFVPFTLDQNTTVTKLFTYNGTSVGGNVDVGIYSADGTRLVSSGSTAQSGTSQLQVFSISAITLSPGRYYFAYASNTASTPAIFSTALTTASVETEMIGQMMQLTAFPLPATATFVSFNSTFVPIIGLATVPTL